MSNLISASWDTIGVDIARDLRAMNERIVTNRGFESPNEIIVLSPRDYDFARAQGIADESGLVTELGRSEFAKRGMPAPKRFCCFGIPEGVL